MGGFADHFSGHAAIYAAQRPHYPQALFEWLASVAPARDSAWDAGCGSGQATLGLAQVFERVLGTDPSAEQIAAAPAHPRIEYRVETAESTTLEADSIDLVCVAQALHWFDLDRFHRRVHEVLRPEGVIAACSYGLSRVNAEIDAVFAQLHDHDLEPWWPPERRHVENGYRDLAFPYRAVPAPDFDLRQVWTLQHYLGYLRSWSACQRCLRATGSDPVSHRQAQFEQAWGEPSIEREVRFPLTLRVGRLQD